MKIEKIDHLSKTKAVNHIAQSPSKDHSKGCRYPWFAWREFGIKVNDDAQSQPRNCKEKKSSCPCCLPSQQPKGATSVSNVSQCKKSRNDLQVFMKRKALHDNFLGDLIKQEDDANNEDRSGMLSFQVVEPVLVTI